MCLCVRAFMCYQIIFLYCVVIQIGEHNRVIWKQNKCVYDLSNMLVSFYDDIVVLVHFSICDFFVYH
jgi:hypothetical protein